MPAITEQALNDIMMGKDGTYSPTERDVLRHQIWDTRFFAATPTNAQFFVQPIGAPWRAGTAKTTNETNLAQTGQLPAGQTMLVKKVTVRCISFDALDEADPEDVAQAFYNVLHSSVFELKVASREFEQQWHGSQFLPAVAISGSSTVNHHIRVGDLIGTGSLNLEPTPVFLGSQVSFNVTHTLGNPDVTNIQGTGLPLTTACAKLLNVFAVMQIILEGTLTRAK